MAQLDDVRSHKLEQSQWHRSSSACHMMQVECCQRWQRCIILEFCFPFRSWDALNSCSLRNQFCCTANRTGEAARYVMDTTRFGWLSCFGLSEQTNWCITCRWQVTTDVGGKEATSYREPAQILQQLFTRRHFIRQLFCACFKKTFTYTNVFFSNTTWHTFLFFAHRHNYPAAILFALHTC